LLMNPAGKGKNTILMQRTIEVGRPRNKRGEKKKVVTTSCPWGGGEKPGRKGCKRERLTEKGIKSRPNACQKSRGKKKQRSLRLGRFENVLHEGRLKKDKL